MLETLRIKNIAIIDAAEIRFKSGLNIISGETGAGKSILIEAIALLLGCRASSDLIRSGCEEGIVEGLFSVSNIQWIQSRLEKYGFNANTELIIKRTVHRSGRHRISINGELATLATLQNLCEGLVDLCGQHEHQSLLKPHTQLELLDRYGSLLRQSQLVSNQLVEFRALKKELKNLQTLNEERVRKADFLQFQMNEIHSAQLQTGEDQSLLNEKQLLQSAEARAQGVSHVLQFLDSEEGGFSLLRTALQKIRSLQALDSHVVNASEALERAVFEVEEVILLLNRYGSTIVCDTERLQIVQERLSLIGSLKRKYGSDIPMILQTLSELEKEYHRLNQIGQSLETLSQQIEQQKEELLISAQKLSRKRRRIGTRFAKVVTDELKDLKMGEAQFNVELTFLDDIENWNHTGADCIQFLVQPNPGEIPRPLGKIASGGELSRLMLAIRRVISDEGGIGVYLFDEIDAGIGGQTAFQVGKKLKSVAENNQVICITHLPQVASFASHHLIVRKEISESRTKTEIIELNRKQRQEELARMLGGPSLTQKNLENASELLEMARA